VVQILQMKKKEEEEETRITITEVKTNYRLSEKDVKELKYIEKRNPHYGGAPPMRLYLLSDILHICKNKKKFNNQLIHDRIEKLYKNHKIKVEYINEYLRSTVFEDFIVSKKKPRILIGTIKKRYKAALYIQANLPNYKYSKNLVIYYSENNQNNDIKLEEILKRYENYKDIVIHLFSNLSYRIIEYLDETSIANFENSYHFVKELLADRYNPEMIEEKIKYQIKDLSLTNDFQKNLVKKYTWLAKQYVFLQKYYIQNIRSMLKTDDVQRRKILVDALKKHDLHIREDSKLCKVFINEGIPSLDEVVSIMRITDYLFSYSHRIWSQNNVEFNIFLYSYVANGDTFYEATNKLLCKLPVNFHFL
jgi:hypothetical protein